MGDERDRGIVAVCLSTTAAALNLGLSEQPSAERQEGKEAISRAGLITPNQQWDSQEQIEVHPGKKWIASPDVPPQRNKETSKFGSLLVDS